MKFELKKIEFSEQLSQDTNAYAAVLYIDGKKQFAVSNSGHGGCDMQHEIGDMKIEDVNNWLRANRPPLTHKDITIDHDLELECSDLLEKHLVRKSLMRMCGRGLVTMGKNGEIYQRKGKPSNKLTAQDIDTMTPKLPGEVIVTKNQNMDEAVNAFRRKQ